MMGYIICSWKDEVFPTLLGREPVEPARDLKDSGEGDDSKAEGCARTPFRLFDDAPG